MQETIVENLLVVANVVNVSLQISESSADFVFKCLSYHGILPKICHACVSPKPDPNFPHMSLQ